MTQSAVFRFFSSFFRLECFLNNPYTVRQYAAASYLFLKNMKTIVLFAFLCLCSFAVAQESESVPPQPPVGPRVPTVTSPMGGMSPPMMLRLRDQMTRELQQIQRQLQFIDPSEVPLRKTLTDMQADILTQLQDINAQLKEQGISPQDDVVDTSPLPPASYRPQAGMPRVPAIPPGTDPTLVPGGLSQPSTTPPVPRPILTFGDAGDPVSTVPRNSLPSGMMGGFVPGMSEVPPYTPMPGVPAPAPRIPTAHDQDQAWADSPWAPRPSKELAELKQTIDGLRAELGEMRETTKALETQIQLLNRHFLLMTPQK